MTNIHTMTCPICSRIFTSDTAIKCCGTLIAHAKTKHGLNPKPFLSTYIIDVDILEAYRIHKRQYSKQKLRDPNYTHQVNQSLINKIGLEEFNKLPKCELCEYRGKQLYKHIHNIHEISVDEYKNRFTSKLETPEYLEYLSNTRSGDKNPMYNNGSSDLSPWSVDFYIKKGHSLDEATELKSQFIHKVNKNKPSTSHPTRIEYYMNKYKVSEEVATDMLYKHQTTNSVVSIASRNNISLDEAQLIRDEITTKWINTLNAKSPEEIAEINKKKLTGNYPISGISTSFFNDLVIEFNLSTDDVKYNKNELYLSYIDDTKTRHFKYDFMYNNKIIEYNGDRYHANPLKYNASDIPITWTGNTRNLIYNKTAEFIWNHDNKKIQLAKDNGYEVLVIWHSYVKRNRYRELRKCKEFLGV